MPVRIAVVDENDRFVRWTDRATIHSQQLVHRSIQVLLFDSQGRLVLQQRHRDKLTCPGQWDLSCSGHVEEDDYPGAPDELLEQVYRGCAARELREELGVSADLEHIGHFAPIPGINYEQTHVFRAFSDGPYVAQPEEIEALRTVSAQELAALFQRADEPLTENLRYFGRWFLEHGLWPEPRTDARRRG